MLFERLQVKECFLVISEKSGESKGYGLVKYCSCDAASQAKHLLDGRIVQSNYKIICEWLNSSHITYKSLHSKVSERSPTERLQYCDKLRFPCNVIDPL